MSSTTVHDVGDQPRNALRKRLGITVAVSVAVAISLLAFPNAILWMVAAWITCYCVVLRRSRIAWLPLIACVAILLIKRPYWSPWLIAITVFMVAVAATHIRTSAVYAHRTQAWTIIAALWLLWLATMWDARAAKHCAAPLAFNSSRPVVCLGDSLTTGLSAAEAYPTYLEELVASPVVNMGRAGIAAREALKQLPAVLKANPQVVVIELGGHDFLRRYGKTATRESLVQIIETCHNAGAAVVLFEIPRGFIVDPFGGLERELARTYDLELIPDTAVRQLVLRSPTFPPASAIGKAYLSDDGLHPNKAGAQLLAQYVRDALTKMYGPTIVSPDR